MLQDHWYPLARTQDLPRETPRAVQLLGEALVLFRDAAGVPRCLVDRCSHRSVPLSLGRVCAGKIECIYHGWQFGGDGECARIPTLDVDDRKPKNADITARATVERHGLIWVYAGEKADADPSRIHHYPQLTSPDWWVAGQGVMSLDVDYSLVIENLVDASHVPFVHRGTLATPDQAQPLKIDVRTTADGGLHSVVKATRTPVPIPDYIAFDVPCHVRIGRDDGSITRLFHCIPAAPGKMVMLWWLALHRPQLDLRTRLEIQVPYLARRHEATMKADQESIYAEDIAMLKAQQAQIDLGAKSFACPVKADLMALRCREWREANDGPGTWHETPKAPVVREGLRKLPMHARNGTTG